jgi:VWFA-related protein
MNRQKYRNRHRLVIVFGIFCFATFPLTLFSQKPAQRSGEDYKLVVDINLVEIQAIVTTPNGAPVPNLKKEDFQIDDNGKEQEIAVFGRELNQPLSLCLLFDASASIFIELKTEQEAALEFLNKVIRPVDRVSIYQVSDDVHELVHASSRIELFAPALRSIKAGGDRKSTRLNSSHRLI